MNFYEEEQWLDPVLERVGMKSNIAESTQATELFKWGPRKQNQPQKKPQAINRSASIQSKLENAKSNRGPKTQNFNWKDSEARVNPSLPKLMTQPSVDSPKLRPNQAPAVSDSASKFAMF